MDISGFDKYDNTTIIDIDLLNNTSDTTLDNTSDTTLDNTLDNKTNKSNNIDDDAENNYKININTNYTPVSLNDKYIYMTRSGAFIKFADLAHSYKAIKKIQNYFTLKTVLFNGQIKQVKQSKIDRKKERIIVPRFGIFEILNKKFGLHGYAIKCQISSGENPVEPFKWNSNMELTNNQKIIYNYLMKNVYSNERVNSGSAGAILNLEAGQGKSYLATYLMHIFQKKTAIILHSTALIEQWVKVLKSCYNNSIGYYYGLKKIDGDIIIFIIDSALNDIFTFRKHGSKETVQMHALDFYKIFGYIIYDECHEYASKMRSKAFKNAQATYMLGLSATPDENNMKFDPVVWWELGPVIKADSINGYQSTKNSFCADVHRIMYYGPSKYTKLIKNEITGVVSVSNTINMICEDKLRTQLVIKCIDECLNKGLYTFVFADRREYLEEIRILLKKKGELVEIVTNDEDYVRVVGGAKLEVLEQAEQSAKVILTTYGYMGTGKSVVKMNGLVLATPRKSKMKQYINRIFRLGSDASIKRHIYDIVDMKITLKNQWNTRKLYYLSKGYSILEEKIKYENI